MRWKDGGIYEGDWKNDRRSGMGKKSYANGDVYIGQWKSGKRHVCKLSFQLILVQRAKAKLSTRVVIGTRVSGKKT